MTDNRSQPKGDYPSTAAMKAAVELEIRAAIGQIQTVGIGQLIQSVVEAEITSLKADNEGLKKALNAVSVPADVRKLKARIEELEAKTALVTFNEACKRIEALEALLEFWIYDGRLQTFEDRERFRKAVRAALSQSSTPAVSR